MNNFSSEKEILWSDSSGFESEYDWTAISPSTAILESLAQVREMDPLEMEPLYPAIDLDAVDALLTHGCDTSLQLAFTVAGFRVLVTGDGLVRIHSADEVAEG